MLLRGEAIDRATTLIVAQGGRVVPTFDGIVNHHDELISKLSRVWFEDGRWYVAFTKLDPPDVITHPGECLVQVHPGNGHVLRISLI